MFYICALVLQTENINKLIFVYTEIHAVGNIVCWLLWCSLHTDTQILNIRKSVSDTGRNVGEKRPAFTGTSGCKYHN